MEPNDNQLGSFFQQHHQQQHHQSAAAAISPTNGLLSNADASHSILYPHSVASAMSSQLEPAKRKRGRPRKYGTLEQALAANKAATSSSQPFSSADKKPRSPPPFSSSASFSSSKKSHSFALGNAGQGFTLHVISVAAGEMKIGAVTPGVLRAVCEKGLLLVIITIPKMEFLAESLDVIQDVDWVMSLGNVFTKRSMTELMSTIKLI